MADIQNKGFTVQKLKLLKHFGFKVRKRFWFWLNIKKKNALVTTRGYCREKNDEQMNSV